MLSNKSKETDVPENYVNRFGPIRRGYFSDVKTSHFGRRRRQFWVLTPQRVVDPLIYSPVWRQVSNFNFIARLLASKSPRSWLQDRSWEGGRVGWAALAPNLPNLPNLKKYRSSYLPAPSLQRRPWWRAASWKMAFLRGREKLQNFARFYINQAQILD